MENLMKLSVYNELSLRWALEDEGWTSIRVWRRAVLWDTNFHGWKISWNLLFTMNFHWRTEVGWVYEGEGWLSYETITSMDGKSHETVCLLRWALEDGGWTSVRGWRRAVLWDNNFHWSKISWNCLFIQMSPGGRRLDECTKVKEGCLMRP